MLGEFVNSMASRSMPMPSPAVGGMPCSSARYLLALWLFVAGFAAQLAIRHLLSARTVFSPDAVIGLSFGAEALAFLLTGFLVSFLARGFGWRELGAAAFALAVVAFLVLHRMKPPSFS